MDFAKKQLQKYGWQEGKGLGKSEQGRSIPILPKLKFDNAGVGHDPSEEFTNNWWENLYDTASSNVEVTLKKGKVKLRTKEQDSVEISTKSYSLKNLKKNNNLEYGSFIKTSKLTDSGIVDLENGWRNLSISDSTPKIPILTDEQLLSVCGGRTAHKGARHGLKLSGKLSRIEKQEKLLLKKMKMTSLGETDNKINKKNKIEKKLKKLDYIKKKEKYETVEDEILLSPNDKSQITLSPSSHKNIKKRKKEKKRVCFNETVTEYHVLDTESNGSDNSIVDLPNDEDTKTNSLITVTKAAKLRDKNAQLCNNNNNNNNNNAYSSPSDQDEGIDCPDLDNITDEPEKIEDAAQNIKQCSKCTKRKIKTELEDCSKVSIKKCHYDCKRYIKEQKRLSIRGSLKSRKLFQKEGKEAPIDSVADSLYKICNISDKDQE